MNLEFKDSYEEKAEGKVKLRLQYVFDEELLFSNILKAYQERKELIEKCIELLEDQKEAHYKTLTESIRIIEENQEYDNASCHAGFYSIVENDSVLHSDSYRSPTMNKYVEKDAYIENLCSYDLTDTVLKLDKPHEEEKSQNVPFSARNNW